MDSILVCTSAIGSCPSRVLLGFAYEFNYFDVFNSIFGPLLFIFYLKRIYTY